MQSEELGGGGFDSALASKTQPMGHIMSEYHFSGRGELRNGVTEKPLIRSLSNDRTKGGPDSQSQEEIHGRYI